MVVLAIHQMFRLSLPPDPWQPCTDWVQSQLDGPCASCLAMCTAWGWGTEAVQNSPEPPFPMLQSQQCSRQSGPQSQGTGAEPILLAHVFTYRVKNKSYLKTQQLYNCLLLPRNLVRTLTWEIPELRSQKNKKARDTDMRREENTQPLTWCHMPGLFPVLISNKQRANF